MENVTREVFLDADPQDVWEAVTSDEQLSDWFGDVDGTIEAGEVVRFTTQDGEQRRAIIERVDEPRELVFRWLPTADDAASRVDITIDEVADGSLLRVTEQRFDAAVSPVPQIGFKTLARL